MTSEPAPFLAADSVGKEYRTRHGAKVNVINILKNGCFVVATDFSAWVVNPAGMKVKGYEDKFDILPPAPQPDRRTVWLNVYEDSAWALASRRNANVTNSNDRQGEAVPVNLERQPDGNWRVVSELTPNQAAADEMYDNLRKVRDCILTNGNFVEDQCKKSIYETVLTALYKAEGWS